MSKKMSTDDGGYLSRDIAPRSLTEVAEQTGLSTSYVCMIARGAMFKMAKELVKEAGGDWRNRELVERIAVSEDFAQIVVKVVNEKGGEK